MACYAVTFNFTFETTVNLKDTLSSQSMVTQKQWGKVDAKGKN